MNNEHAELIAKLQDESGTAAIEDTAPTATELLAKLAVDAACIKHYRSMWHHSDCALMEPASFETLGNKCTCKIYPDEITPIAPLRIDLI